MPNSLTLMRVWHTNVEDPASTRQSKVPVPLQPPIQDVPMDTESEDFTAFVPVVDSVPARPKRKQGNDSVSHATIRITGSSVRFHC